MAREEGARSRMIPVTNLVMMEAAEAVDGLSESPRRRSGCREARWGDQVACEAKGIAEEKGTLEGVLAGLLRLLPREFRPGAWLERGVVHQGGSGAAAGAVGCTGAERCG